MVLYDGRTEGICSWVEGRRVRKILAGRDSQLATSWAQRKRLDWVKRASRGDGTACGRAGWDM